MQINRVEIGKCFIRLLISNWRVKCGEWVHYSFHAQIITTFSFKMKFFWSEICTN